MKPLRPNQLRAGHRVRDFRIVRRLGVGGFSFVFLMKRRGQRYVLKMAARAASEKDLDKVDAWMRREVTSLEHLAHPHLLPVLEWGRWPDPETGYGYYVTPYVSGSTFHEWRWRERAPLNRGVRVLCDFLKTLEALHERGICHRDVKADNLLVSQEDDTPFLIDFGAVHLPWARVLTEGLAPGTLYCQPPEAVLFLAALLSKDAPRDARLEAQPSADLYAFGVLLYETLTNRRPFSTRGPLEKLLGAIATTPPVEPGLLAPEAPASLCALASRLLAKNPDDRPPSARAVREELERLLQQEGHTAPWQAPAERPSENSQVRELFPEVDTLEEPPGLEDSSSMRGWRVGLVALALGLGVLGLGWVLLSEKGMPSMSAPTPPESTFSSPVQEPSRVCALLSSLLGVATAQLVGCASVPVRPDPVAYLASCPPEARATPVKLGFTSLENPSFLESGTPVGELSVEEGGSLNLKPGPVTATMYADVKGQELLTTITGQVETTPFRAYLRFDRLHLPDGTSLPICGVAVDDLHEYGIPTYEKLPMDGARVDPAKVDKSPGSVVLNDPRFETVLQYPEGTPLPRVDMPPPDWR